MTTQTLTTDTGQASGRHMRQFARMLFDEASTAHRLPARLRAALDLAATCYDAARRAADDRPDRLGRDLVLAAPADGLDSDEQAIAASAVALQREKIRPRREPAFVRLRAKDRRLALRLAAILRLAAGLDDANGALVVRSDDGGTSLIVGGADVAAADERADQWRESIGRLLVRAAAPGELDNQKGYFVPENGNGAGVVDPTIALGRPVGAEPVAEATRQILRRFFDKLLAREEAVVKGEDSEDVHQMRVATRRLRASLQVAEGVYDSELIRRYRRGLRRIAQSLGAVRDCDVFLEHVAGYREGLRADRRATLDPLVAAVAAERLEVRKKLLSDLDSKRYAKFKRAFATFLTSPGAGTLPPPEPGIIQRVRDFAGSSIWRRYELWRAYETALPGATDATLHQARIAGKHLRYTLELFADALGPNVGQVLDPLIALQECLGALQDGVTAREHVAMLGLADDAGAQEYLDARDAERDRLLAELPARWEKVASATYRRRLFELIVKM
jgi:CHAD domain-containing protein